MSDPGLLVFLRATLGGFGLGSLFFGGLWFTLCHLPRVQSPGRWLTISYGIRLGLLAMGILSIGLRVDQVLGCILGIGLARWVWVVTIAYAVRPVLMNSDRTYR